MKKVIYKVLASSIILASCQTEKKPSSRSKNENYVTPTHKAEEQANISQLNEEYLKREEERIQEEEEIYNAYIENSLNTGDIPYSSSFGSNSNCSDYGCSQIKVTTPDNSDVLVTIKENGRVIQHAYIKAADNYTFSFPNGKYQAFFYYGKGWNPNKSMKNGKLKGGFISNEYFGKDEPQILNNNILQYELILQQNGNFSTKPSNSDEAL